MDCTYVNKGHCYVRRIPGPEGIGCLGHPSQAKFISDAVNPYVLSMGPELENVEQPEAILDFMARDRRAASAGGWRHLSRGEKAALMMGCLRDEKITREIVNWCLLNHPAVRGGFLYSCPECAPQSIFYLFMDIYDILRFPDQASMFSWMHLSHFSNFDPSDSRFASAKLVSVWAFNGMKTAVLGRETESFFLRYAFNLSRQGGGGSDSSNDYKVAWKTVRKLASFLRFTWIEGTKNGGDPFLPDLFFGSKSEGKKFRDYIEKLNKQLDNFPHQSKISLLPMGEDEKR